jgi:hypothetical protein
MFGKSYEKSWSLDIEVAGVPSKRTDLRTREDRIMLRWHCTCRRSSEGGPVAPNGRVISGEVSPSFTNESASVCRNRYGLGVNVSTPE